MKKRLIEACLFMTLLALCTSLVFAITGCSKHNIDFNPSNSMCLDAVVANIHAAGCEAVSVEKATYGITKVRCYDIDIVENETDSEWLRNEFYGIAFGTRIPPEVKPICTDPYMIMTTAERD